MRYPSFVKSILRNYRISGPLLDCSLKLHSRFYQLSSLLSLYNDERGIHPKHRLMDYHEWFAGHIEKDWVVMDVGCGNGALAQHIALHCRRIISLDNDIVKIAIGNQKYKEIYNLDFVCADAMALPFHIRFDAIVLSNIIEHLQNRIDFLKAIMEFGDILLVRVPMVDRDWITLYKKERGLFYFLDPTHTVEYDFEGFETEMNSAGLRIIEHRVRYGEIYAVCTR